VPLGVLRASEQGDRRIAVRACPSARRNPHLSAPACTNRIAVVAPRVRSRQRSSAAASCRPQADHRRPDGRAANGGVDDDIGHFGCSYSSAFLSVQVNVMASRREIAATMRSGHTATSFRTVPTWRRTVLEQNGEPSKRLPAAGKSYGQGLALVCGTTLLPSLPPALLIGAKRESGLPCPRTVFGSAA
jgi:hypothetical protein